VAAKLGPSGRRLELGIQLRQLRENCPPVEEGRSKGMTRKAACRGLEDLSEATLGRIEAGEINFRRKVGNLRVLLERYGVGDPDLIGHLIELNREAPKEDWLYQHQRFMPKGMPHYLGLETEAIGITAYHPSLIHGLLQTEDYARALLESHRLVEDATAESVRSNIEVRMERKARVLNPQDREPARLRIILGEAALRTPYGDDEVMRGQYEETIRLARMDHIDIHMLPIQRSYRADNDFAILNLGPLPTQVQTDTAWGGVATSDKPREVERFTRRFDAMAGSALGAEETIKFLHQLVEG
jgi:hypothetical protein